MRKLLFLLPAIAFADEGGSNSSMSSLVIIAISLLFFYFILWRPEQKRRKSAEAMRSALKVGDHVTAMGIVGTISKINEQTVIVKMIDGAKIEMVKGAITEVRAASSPAAE